VGKKYFYTSGKIIRKKSIPDFSSSLIFITSIHNNPKLSLKTLSS